MPKSHPIFAIFMSCFLASSIAEGAGENPKLTLPSIQLPEAGNLQGSAAKFRVDATTLSQGSISLPLPIDIDQRKGPLLMSPFPSYSPHNGLSAWGMGWEANLAIIRYREIGDIDFQSDLLSSPWGILEKGSDGFWYPRGLRTPVKVSFNSAEAKATLPDGTELFFQKPIPSSAPSQDYGFVLSKALDKKGHISLYEWQDDKQRLLLDEVRYGGFSESSLPYSIRFIYTPLAAKGFHFSFKSKKAIPIDRQLSTVQFFDQDVSLVKARWTFDLQQQSSKYSPAFLLTSLKKNYIGGDSEPAVSFSYELFDDWIKKATFESLSSMDKITSTVGNRFVRPDAFSFYDYNLDGLIDIETAGDHQLYLQSQEGFIPVQKFSPTTPSLCLPADRETNRSRTITRLSGYRSELRVLVRESRNQGAKTSLTICSLDGRMSQELSVDANFNIDARTAFGDVNQDGKPDFVRLLSDSYSVLLNSSEEDNFKFEIKGPFPIKNASSIQQLDITDINGDGLADLVAKDQDQLRVFAGLGNLSFAQAAIPFPFLDDSGARQTLSKSSNLQYIDANADGLLDLSFTEGTRFFLLMNRGTDFVRVRLPELEGAIGEGEALTINAGGSGEAMIMRTSLKGIRAMRLSSAGMNLLKTWDDGRGSTFGFSYNYGKAFEGQYQLPKVISSWKKTITGKGTITETFAYEKPTVDEALPSYRGFEIVRTEEPGLQNSISFQNPKDAPGLLTRLVAKDQRGQGLTKVTEIGYKELLFRGLKAQVKATEKTSTSLGSISGGFALRTYSYADESLCLQSSLVRLGEDSLSLRTDYGYVEGFDQDLSCLSTAVLEEGRHGRREFDFSHRYESIRNAAGQPLETMMMNGGEKRTLQKLEYDENFRLVTANELVGLSHTYTYVPLSDLLDSHRTSLGVEERVVERELNGLIKSMKMSRGPGNFYEKAFSYDGLERLATVNDSINPPGSNPIQSFGYEFSSKIVPSRITKVTNPASGIAMFTEQFFTADGESMGNVEHLLDSQVLSGFKYFDIASGQEASFSKAVAGGDLRSTWMSLQKTLVPITEGTQNGFGQAFTSSITHQKDVAESLKFPSLVEESGPLEKRLSNDQFETWSRVDGLGRTIQKRDEAGSWTSMAYDMIGRPRLIRLADGQTQSAIYDNWAQLTQISRSSMGSIDYRYNSRGLLEHKDFKHKDGSVYRAMNILYDIHGRPVKRTYAAGAVETSFSFYYDGFTPTPEFYLDQKGHLTAIKAEHFASRFIYDQKGRLLTEIKSMNQGGVRKATQMSYYADDSLKDRKVSIDVSGRATRITNWEHSLRADGRLSEIRLNGNSLAELSYDQLGQLKTASLDSGKWLVNFTSDPVTSELKAYEAVSAQHKASYDIEKDRRGNISSEQVNGRLKTYDYDERSFLTSVLGESGAERFSYNSIGLMATEAPIAAGLVYDQAGRLVQKGGMTMTYDGQGQISSVRMENGSILSYGYDESHLRNLKTKNGEFHSGRLGDTFISNDHVIESLKIGGIVVGYIDNGNFMPLLGDLRGTVFDNGKADNQASAYGKRSSQEIWQSAIDYAGHWRDDDTGIVRMGVRDYDSEQGKFIEPDPLFMEDMSKCVESPVECSLFSYAKNNPLLNIDPFGLDSKVVITNTVERSNVGSPKERKYTTYKMEIYNNTEKWYNKILDFFGFRGPDHVFEVSRDAWHPGTGKGAIISGQGKITRSTLPRGQRGGWLLLTGENEKYGILNGQSGISIHGGSPKGSQGCITIGSKLNDLKKTLESDLDSNKPVVFEIEPFTPEAK